MISTNNFSNFFPELIGKLNRDLDSDKVLLDTPFGRGKVHILAYSISKDKFFLSIESNFDKQFYDYGSPTFNIDFIPLFRVQDGEFLGCVPKTKFKEKIKKVIEKETLNGNLLIDHYWKISFFEQLKSDKFKETEQILLMSLIRKVHYANKNVFDEFDFGHPFHKHLTNLLKFELDRLTYDEFCEIYKITPHLSFFSKKDNGGFILELFGKEYSDKLLYKSYETIKDENKQLSHLYIRNPDLDLWIDKFDEISLNFLFDDKYQFVYDNLFDLFIAKKLLEQGKPVLFEHADFARAILFLDLVEKNPSLTVKITDGVIGGLVDLLDYYDEDRLDYFDQELSSGNLYVPICLPEDEQAIIVEYYNKYSNNKQVEIAEFWGDVVELLSSYKELLDAEFAGTLDLENVILDEFNEQHAMDMEIKSYQYGY